MKAISMNTLYIHYTLPFYIKDLSICNFWYIREVLEPVSLNLTDTAGQLYSLNQDTDHFNMNSLNQEFLLLYIRENNFETQPLERGDCNSILYSPVLDKQVMLTLLVRAAITN